MTEGLGPSITNALASIGRMSLTNYLLHSAIAGFVFYGWGLGLFGSLQMTDLVAVLVTILAANITFGLLWMRRFRFGPVEWCWRWATHRERPHMLRHTTFDTGEQTRSHV
jgi:uncharacterized protein